MDIICSRPPRSRAGRVRETYGRAAGAGSRNVLECGPLPPGGRGYIEMSK